MCICMGMCTHINKDYLDCDPAQKPGGFWSMITIYMYQWEINSTVAPSYELIVLDHKHCLRTHTQILFGVI